MINRQALTQAVTKNITDLLDAASPTTHILEFDFEEIVYLKTDAEQKQFIVTGYQLRPFEAVTYGLTTGEQDETWHYAFEISRKKDIMLSTTN